MRVVQRACSVRAACEQRVCSVRAACEQRVCSVRAACEQRVCSVRAACAQRVRRACGLAGVVGWPGGRGIGKGRLALVRSRARHVPADRVNP